MLSWLAILALSPALALAEYAGQCTFYAQESCGGSTNIQNIPISNFPAYSSFKCNTPVRACWDSDCVQCKDFGADGCNSKSFRDADQAVVNFICFTPHLSFSKLLV
ncbi:unnamed protein product [Parajaminaea phylloscopi]